MTTADLEPLALAAGDLPAPGSWRGALYREDAPGAALDSQPWAKSWGAFMRAVTREDDASAREFIGQVMSRPANAGFSERIPESGGFLVPEVLRSTLLAYMTTSVVRPHAMVLPMTSLTLGVPYLDNPTQANATQALGGLAFSWTAEGAPITPTVAQVGRAELEARKAAARLQGVTNELIEDAAGPFGELLGSVTSRGFAWFEDDFFITGSGVGEPQGLINAPCAVGIDRGSTNTVVFTDLVAMLKALHPAAKAAGLTPGVTSTCWLLSNSAFDQILELYFNPTGTEVVPPSGWFSLGDGQEVGPSLLGLPARVTDHQPALGTTGDVVLADLSQYLIGDRLEMTVERSAQGSGFQTGTSDWRVKARVDGRYWIQSSTTTEAGQTVSPVVVLDVHT